MIVYTALLGNTDPLHEPAVAPGCRLVCFTDQDITSRHWEIVRVPPSANPTRRARTLKALSQDLFPQEDAWLWIDCCITLLADPLELARTAPQDLTTFRHRYWHRITDEARAIGQLGKARPEAVQAQLAAYQAEGFDTPENPQRSLSSTGVLFRRNTAPIREFNQLWATQLQRTLRDQMCVDYCAWKLGVTVGRWPGFLSASPMVRYNHYRRPVNDY